VGRFDHVKGSSVFNFFIVRLIPKKQFMSEIIKKEDGPLSEERIHVLRKQMNGRRYCIDEERSIIFLASLEDIKKYNYHLIQNYPLEKWIAGAENEYEKWSFSKMYEDLTSLNFSEEKDIADE